MTGNRQWSGLNALLCFTGKATSGRYCDLCFSSAHCARKCSLPANNVDVVYGWKMVKSVMASMFGANSLPGEWVATPDHRDPSQVCWNFNAGKCFYGRCVRRNI